CQHNSNWPLTF
nr:immunoglobulin light chain junction region [Macaca mulatta]